MKILRNTIMNKRELRKHIIEKRDAISLERRHSEEIAIIKHLEELGVFLAKLNIFIFLSYNSEVDTTNIIEKIKKSGSAVFVPRVNLKTKTMDIVKYPKDKDFTLNKYGIREPKASLPAANPAEIDIVISPGAAFTKNLDRLGYGGGYYDKFFPELKPEAKIIAICYDEQIVEHIPVEEHDKKMDYVVSASKICK